MEDNSSLLSSSLAKTSMGNESVETFMVDDDDDDGDNDEIYNVNNETFTNYEVIQNQLGFFFIVLINVLFLHIIN